MFGKKKEKVIPAFHYEGLPDFPTDFPCSVEAAGDDLVITKKKPGVTVTVPIGRITSVSPMSEKDYMMKYHGHSDVRKIAGTTRHFLAVEYTSQAGDDKRFALWAPTHQALALNSLHSIRAGAAPTSHTL